jgi:hypothetical protein
MSGTARELLTWAAGQIGTLEQPIGSNDGSFGTLTIIAYAQWQTELGFAGDDADGIPGRSSLIELGHRHGFS